MVKEESDIISRAGAMKRGGEKVTGGSETPGAPQLWGVLALQLCFLQGSIPGCFGTWLPHLDIFPPCLWIHREAELRVVLMLEKL